MAKYNSVDTIPAKVFFEILKTKDLNLLIPNKGDNLEEIFSKIYDDFYTKMDNEESKNYLRLASEISFLEYKIMTLKQCLHFYFTNKTTKEMREEFANALKEGLGILIDLNVPFIDEVQRILSIEIGIIENDLNLAKIDFDKMIKTSQSKDFDYFDDIGILGQVLQGNNLVKEDMTLALYISLNKLAKRMNEKNNKK